MRVISEPDKGIDDALNKGITAAGEDVVGLMHSDDFFAHRNVLDSVVESFAQTDADAVYGDLDHVSANDPNSIIHHWKSGTYTQRNFARGWMPPHPALFVRPEVFTRFGVYDTSYQTAADYDAMLRWLWTGGIRVANVLEVFIKMRVGRESIWSLDRILRKSREYYRALNSNGVGGNGALAWKNLSKLPQFLNK